MRQAAIATLGFVLMLIHGLAEPLKPFPDHWGNPPAIQTRDYVEWPDGYGHGSSTVANWIRVHLKKDAAGEKTASPVLYAADFESVNVGELPEDFMVLNGQFAVVEQDGEKVMQLPGTPLDSYAVMFGPAGNENMALTARIRAESKGRRHPAFAIGLNGLGGYRLRLAPAKRNLELIQGPEEEANTVATSPFHWKSGAWVTLRLQVRKTGDGRWLVEGMAWMEGAAEPVGWMVSHVETKEPLPGRPWVMASPYSGTAIRFDDLRVSVVQK